MFYHYFFWFWWTKLLSSFNLVIKIVLSSSTWWSRMFYLYPRLRLLSAQLTWPVSRYRETGYLVQPKPDLCLLLTEIRIRSQLTQEFGQAKVTSKLNWKKNWYYKKKNKFSTFQTAVERKGLGIILGEPSVSLRRVCLPHKLAGVDVIWPFCVI